MIDTFLYTFLRLLRTPGILIWALIFPIVLSTVFYAMFGPLDDMAEFDPIPIAVVEPDDDAAGEAFSQFIDAMSDDEDGSALFAVTYVADAAEAEDLVVASEASDEPMVGYVQLRDGVPEAFVIGESSLSGMENLYSSILVLAMDEYVARSAFLQELVDTEPAALQNPEVMASLFEPVEATVKVQLTENQPRESVRYYFALLGMAALFGASVGMDSFQRLKPNVSALGARRSLGSVSHGRAVAATLLASWCFCFLCLLIAYLYMRFPCGVDFGNRDIGCILVTAVASLAATGLGCAISAIPKVPESGKSGILTGIVCFASLFAGLYGQPTMDLADTISRNFPILDYVNPATQISQAFYGIMYYDGWAQLGVHLTVLLVMALIFFLLSLRSLRRQRYASL